jgi:peptidoglycan/LPS O-acetylase OafA/YrhL
MSSQRRTTPKGWLSREFFLSSMRGVRPPNLIPLDPSTGPRLAGVQGLRAAAALSILTFHVATKSSPEGGGFGLESFERWVVPQLALGVTLLLLLSGFLLYRPFAEAVMSAARVPRLRRYLVNRAWRIFPAYWAILLVTTFVFNTASAPVDGHARTGDLAEHSGIFVLNLFLLQGFIPDGVFTGIGPAWALTAVVTFYVVLPLLVLAAVGLAARASSRRGRTLAALVPAAALIGLGLVGKAIGTFVVPAGPSGGWGADWHTVIERSFFAHADIFGFGMAAAVAHVLATDGRRVPRWLPFALLSASLAIALPTTKLLETEVGGVNTLSNSAYDTLMAAAGGLFLLFVLLPPHLGSTNARLLTRVLETRYVVALGVVSYSLFLWHMPVIILLREHGLTLAGAGGFLVNELLVLGMAVALSVCTYHYFERPALIRKTRAPRNAKPEAVAAPHQRARTVSRQAADRDERGGGKPTRAA